MPKNKNNLLPFIMNTILLFLKPIYFYLTHNQSFKTNRYSYRRNIGLISFYCEDKVN